MTASQKQLCRDTVREALLSLSPPESTTRILIDTIVETVTQALDSYPTDRSCHTCDLLHGSTCLRWGEEVPSQALETGCDGHQTDGAPF